MTEADAANLGRLVGKVWQPDWIHRLRGMRINVARYTELQLAIPDKTIIIDEVFPADQISGICEQFEPFLGSFAVWPFLGTLGGNAICIGHAHANRGHLFYHDFDFGTYSLDRDLETFLRYLL
jgi:hypothetical protein